MIPINAPLIGEEEIEAVIHVLKSGIITNGLGMGPMVTNFEKSFAKFVKAKRAIAVNSGTAALHLAVLEAGIKPGDEVIVPSFTFVATAEVVVMTGAKPVFVDINPETYNISPEKINEAITKKTKAIISVDLYGLSADMKKIKEISDENNLVVIEDACQAHGAFYNGKPAGAFADVTCWSFYASKNMTTGEGGMVTTNNDSIADKMTYMRSHGEKAKYNSVILGHNYRMPEIPAAIGCEQLKKLPAFLIKRRLNAKKLKEKLSVGKELQLPMEPTGYKHSWYLYTIRLLGSTKEKRNFIVKQLKQKGIGAEIYYMTPIHLMPFYSKFLKNNLPVTETVANQVFSLPVHPGVTLDQTDFISEAFLNLLT